MSDFDEWCEEQELEYNGNDLVLLTTEPEHAEIGIEKLAGVLPNHYVSSERYAHLLNRLGKSKAAKALEEKLPTSIAVRSGDIGEILASTYIEEQTVWDKSVKKLRWKDHRNMAMRGDDILAVSIPTRGRIGFLKGESKSRVKLNTATVGEARNGLNSNDGKPSPHALAFLSDRLFEEGRVEIADQIDDAQRVNGISKRQVTHMIFTFTGNNPKNFLKNDLEAYNGDIDQFNVGLRVEGHQAFIKAVFEKVTNGDS